MAIADGRGAGRGRDSRAASSSDDGFEGDDDDDDEDAPSSFEGDAAPRPSGGGSHATNTRSAIAVTNIKRIRQRYGTPLSRGYPIWGTRGALHPHSVASWPIHLDFETGQPSPS